MLVYQAGIANLFEVDCFNLASYGRSAKRIYQGDFKTAEAIAYGAGIAGGIVRTAACNMAGDISECTWTTNLEEQPFSEKFRPVNMGSLGRAHTKNRPMPYNPKLFVCEECSPHTEEAYPEEHFHL